MADLKQEVRTSTKTIISWVLAGIGIGVMIILYVFERNWDVAMKALDRGTEANVKVEARRLAEQWRQEDMQRLMAPPPATIPPEKAQPVQ